MFHTFTKPKMLFLALALLIAGVGVFFSFHPEAAGRGSGFIREAFEAAWGGSGSKELAIDLSLYPSSTLSGDLGQEMEGGSDPADWPSLLIGSKPSKKPAGKEPAAVSTAKTPVVLEAETTKPAPVVAGTSPSSSATLASSSEVAAVGTPQWCDFSLAAKASSGVVLNEIAWMGSVQNPNEEWLELKNISGRNLDLRGWQVLNKGGGIKISLGATSSIPQAGFLVFERDQDYSGALNNTGDWLKVFDGSCKIVDELNASSGWPAGDNTTKKTLERDVSGSRWHTSAKVGGSPGAKNSVAASPAPSASTSTSSGQSATSTATSTVSSTVTQHPNTTSTPTSTQPAATTTTTFPPASTTLSHLVIATVQITGGEGLTEQDYIRIFNPTGEVVDISGWRLRKRSQAGTESSIKVFPAGNAIASGAYFTWANAANGFSAAIGASASSTQTLSDNNSIGLFDASNLLMDAVAWGSGHIAPYIEGSAYPENPGADQQLSRKLEVGGMKDTNDNAADFELKP